LFKAFALITDPAKRALIPFGTARRVHTQPPEYGTSHYAR